MNDKIKKAERVDIVYPVSVLMYWSYVPETWSKMIVRITGRQLSDESDAWSHMGLAFRFADKNAEAYEALFDKGFFGPEPLESIVKKIRDKGGAMVVHDTGLGEQEAREVYARCKSWVGKKGYHKWQLVSMWFYERLGQWLGLHIWRSPDRVVCSEAVARLVAGPSAVVPSERDGSVIPPYFDLRDKYHKRFDEVSPNSAWRRWLETRQGVV